MNIFKSPEQYAMLLIDACDGRAMDAVELLKVAKVDYHISQQYYDDCLEVMRKYAVEDWRPDGHGLWTY